MARQHADTAVISDGHNAQNAQLATLFVFLFGRIVHRTIRIRPNSLKPLFSTPLISMLHQFSRYYIHTYIYSTYMGSGSLSNCTSSEHCSDSSHVTAPYKLSFYYYYFYT